MAVVGCDCSVCAVVYGLFCCTAVGEYAYMRSMNSEDNVFVKGCSIN